jgi:hypothetical protein
MFIPGVFLDDRTMRSARQLLETAVPIVVPYIGV